MLKKVPPFLSYTPNNKALNHEAYSDDDDDDDDVHYDNHNVKDMFSSAYV